MALWEQILLGIGAFIVVLLFWPGAKKMLEQSSEAENPDWQGALIPIGAVVLFVVLLIMMVKS